MRTRRRNICFVTGTRAEFGLMGSTLRAIAEHPALRLQMIATGMHMDRRHGEGAKGIRAQGWTVDATVPWKAGSEPVEIARNTGRAMAAIADAVQKLKADVVLVVGDRVEAFAAAAAGRITGVIVAHVHGGDRAAGQVDDCLRHAISKMGHVHFPGTALSRKRLIWMGEDAWRVKLCGSPGVDGIREEAATRHILTAECGQLPVRGYALVVHHPVEADDAAECRRMKALLDSVVRVCDRVVVIHPNNDPGSEGIRRAIAERGGDKGYVIRRDVKRDIFLALMRDAAVMVGNSSSGIIEAASFGLPVIDVGPRQLGRECGDNVVHVPASRAAINAALRKLSDEGFPRFRGGNIYGGRNVGRRIAMHLATIKLDDRLRRKLIAY